MINLRAELKTPIHLFFRAHRIKFKSNVIFLKNVAGQKKHKYINHDNMRLRIPEVVYVYKNV